MFGISERAYCLNCKNWGGDKQKMKNEINENGMIVMDHEKGWPESGDCAMSHQWAEITIYGDAIVDMEIPANFGCIFHKKIHGRRNGS